MTVKKVLKRGFGALAYRLKPGKAKTSRVVDISEHCTLWGQGILRLIAVPIWE